MNAKTGIEKPTWQQMAADHAAAEIAELRERVRDLEPFPELLSLTLAQLHEKNITTRRSDEGNRAPRSMERSLLCILLGDDGERRIVVRARAHDERSHCALLREGPQRSGRSLKSAL